MVLTKHQAQGPLPQPVGPTPVADALEGSLPAFDTVYRRVLGTVTRTFEQSQFKLRFVAMSTECRVVFHGVTDREASDFQAEVVRWVAAFEAKYSRFIPASLVGRINAAAGRQWVDLDPEADQVFGLCDAAVFFTRGAFDPTALPIVKLWNWKTPPSVLPSSPDVEQAKQKVGWRKVQRRPGAIFLPEAGMSIDLGGIGKEYAVDRVFTMARQRGIQNVLVDFGHDVRAAGGAPGKGFWSIGLEDPKSTGHCWVGLAISDRAVATSGDYLRNFEVNGRRFGHIVDPRTGYPVDNGCRAVSVCAQSCTVAGMLSTTAFILGPSEGTRLIESHLGADGAITTDRDRVTTRRFYELLLPS